jgi:5-methylcytosine-specific restriction enzyme B
LDTATSLREKAIAMTNEFSQDCIEVLERLKASKNVLVSGSPGTGKSRLLGEVGKAFAVGLPVAGVAAMPVHNPKAKVPIPPTAAPSDPGLVRAMPCPAKTARKVFRTVFHQNSKHRDFVTGMIPNTQRKPGEPDFVIIEGPLFTASEHAKSTNGASLLIIDEINRGPAVQVFGGAIVAIEGDKRLSPEGTPTSETQFFDVLSQSGSLDSYALPDDLYILAAMNQADASVEPLDVAFLRRWEPYVLDPSSEVLRKHFGINGPNVVSGNLPDVPTEAKQVLEASVRAWEKVNRQISLGRGSEFQIGHGVLMGGTSADMTKDAALQVSANNWAKVRAHVQEVFFGDLRGIAATLNAIDGPPFHPLRLVETSFADDIRYELTGPSQIGPDKIYDALRAIGQ